MKRIAFIVLLVLIVVGSANAQQFIVRTVYFQPTDAPAPSDRIPDLMLEVQDFYRAEMERHGYGGKTFKLETHNNGVPAIHTVNGRHSASYYQSQTWDRILPELPSQFQNENRIHVIIIGNTQLINNSFCGLGWDFVGTGISQGFLLVPEFRSMPNRVGGSA